MFTKMSFKLKVIKYVVKSLSLTNMVIRMFLAVSTRGFNVEDLERNFSINSSICHSFPLSEVTPVLVEGCPTASLYEFQYGFIVNYHSSREARRITVTFHSSTTVFTICVIILSRFVRKCVENLSHRGASVRSSHPCAALWCTRLSTDGSVVLLSLVIADALFT